MDELDPFVAPRPSHPVGDVQARSRVVLRGLVLHAEVVAWDGGPVLEVTIWDGSGTIHLAFFGRQRIGGVERGRVLTVAGMVGRRGGRPILLNPRCWLHAPLEEGRRA